MDILNLFLAFLRVGSLSIGGGYVLIPLIEKEVVQNYGWLTAQEFTKVLGVTQAVPGAISVKFATFTGYKVGGIIGIVAANLGILLPPVIIMLALFKVLEKTPAFHGGSAILQGVKFGTLGLLAAITLNVGKSLPLEGRGIFIAVISFLSVALLKLHPGLVVLASGILGVLIFIK